MTIDLVGPVRDQLSASVTLSWSSRLLFGAETTASSTVAAAVAAAELDGPVFLDGGRLRAIRADRGIADGALRKAAGCPLSTWRALLTGQVPADVALVQLLCRTLGIEPAELMVVSPRE